MGRCKLLVLGAFACLVALPTHGLSEEAHGRPFLWVVEGESPVYLLGTFHASDERLTNLPEIVRAAAQASDVLLRETLKNDKTSREINDLMTAKDGKTVQQRLAPELYARLKKLIPEEHLPEYVWKDFNLIGVLAVLGMRETLAELGKQTMDARIEALFKTAKKPVEALETIEEVTAPTVALSAAERVKLVADTVGQIEKMEREGRSPFKETLAAYLTGDLETLVKQLDGDFDPEDAMQVRLRKLNNDDRNARLAERLLAKQKDNPKTTYFVMVGVGHFPREKGLLKLLAAKGRKVRRLKPGDKLPGTK